VQPYAPSVVEGETSLLFFDGELSHAVRKVPKDGDYRAQALRGGTEEVHEATAKLIEPDLFLRTSPGSLERCVDMVEAHLP
jgi:Prokaryotic glutathione synthetase, ATP-grasp domain